MKQDRDFRILTVMRRYFFHVPDDTQGTVLPDDRAAVSEARQLMGQMLRDGELKPGTPLSVVDSEGRVIARLRFLQD